jgi:2-phosphosulfolactate phosphatase
MARTVAFAHYPGFDDVNGSAVVGVDVIRATTTAVTAAAAGLRCFPIATLDEAAPLLARLENPVLAGELGGNKPFGFEVQNSPVEMTLMTGQDRPVVLLSTSGTAMLCAAASHGRPYVACLRNMHAQAERLLAEHDRVVLLVSESRGELRDEDLLCCAGIARHLIEAGFEPRDRRTEELVGRWSGVPVDVLLEGHSAAYLAATGQTQDLEFILGHVDDLHSVYELRDGEVLASDPV